MPRHQAGAAAAATGVCWLDPDQKGAGSKYQVLCEMVQYGGGWLKIDNGWANTLLTMTNPATLRAQRA